MAGKKTWRGFIVREDNVPMKRPGLYRFKNVHHPEEDHGNYIGITGIRDGIHGRCKDHPSGSPAFEDAVGKYGKASFLLTPLYYLLAEEADDGDRLFLQHLESDMIAEFDAAKNGYNIKEREGSVGPYGPKFGAIMKASLEIIYQNDPTAKIRHLEGAQRGAITTHAEKDPLTGKSIVAQRAGQSTKSRFDNDPDYRARALLLAGQGGTLATSELDPIDGKSIHARRMRTAAAPTLAAIHAIKDESGKSALAVRSGRAAAKKTHSKVDELGRSIAGVKMSEKVHAEKTEDGKSVHAVRSGEASWAATQADPDALARHKVQAGRGGSRAMELHGERLRANALKNTHRERDAFGRSLQALSCSHVRTHVKGNRPDPTCPHCNPNGYVEAYNERQREKESKIKATHTERYIAQRAAGAFKLCGFWINNGVKQRRIEDLSAIPEGWAKGRIKRV